MTIEQVDTQRLIVRAQAGDAAAAEELVRAHHAPIYRLALSLLDDETEADEAAQDALLKAIERLASFRGEASFGTWLYAIALNECRGRLRQRRARQRLTQVLHVLFRSELDAAPPIETVLIKQQEHNALWQAIQALPDKQREVILLRYYSDLKIIEIAQVLGLTDRAVRARLSAANDRLRLALQDEVKPA